MSTKPLTLLRERLRYLLNIAGPATTAVLGALLVLAIAALVWLVITGGPWENALQRKLARGSSLQWREWRQLGIGWGLVGFVTLATGVLLSARWWITPCRSVFAEQIRPSLSLRARQLYLLALLLTAAATWMMRAPRLTHSFWNDEEMAFRKYVWGETKVLPDGSLHFQPATWGEALFDNKKANNQIGATLETRLGLALFNHPDAAAPPGLPAFQESAARSLAFLSSGLSVLALGWLGWLLGVPRIGLAAAWLMALSPWHVRYSVEIRGYSTLLLMLCVALGSLLRALETGRWRWWLAFAAAQAWYLLCFAGALYVAVVMNTIVLLCIWRSAQDSRSNTLRWLVASTFSLLPLALLLVPALLQIMAYVAVEKQRGPAPALGLDFLQDLWSHLTIGMSQDQDVGWSHGTNVLSLISQSPWMGPWLCWLLPVAAGLGIAGMLWKDWRSRLVAVPLLIGALLATLHAIISHGPFMTWYLVYLIPLFSLGLPYAATWAPRALRVWPLVAVAILFLITADARQRLQTTPRQPMREAAQSARQENTTTVGTDPQPLTAVFSTSADQIFSYDPRAILLTSPEQLTALTAQAHTEARRLAVYFCNRDPAPDKHATLCRDLGTLLDDPTHWTLLQRLPGLEPRFSYEIYLLNP